MMTDKLREAAQAALSAMSVVRVFVTSKEKIKHPEGTDWYDNIISNLEAALAEPAIKESLTVAEQEPVAWKHPDKNMVFWEDTKKVDEYHGFKLTIPLYTAPPRREAQERMHPEIKKMYEDYFDKCFRESSAQQRPWVGLTGTEINHIFAANVGYPERMMKEVEILLKDKNT